MCAIFSSGDLISLVDCDQVPVRDLNVNKRLVENTDRSSGEQ